MNDNIVYVKERTSGLKAFLIFLLLVVSVLMAYDVYKEESGQIRESIPVFATVVEQQRSEPRVVFPTTEPAEIRLVQPTWVVPPVESTGTSVPVSTPEQQRGHNTEESGNERGQNSTRP